MNTLFQSFTLISFCFTAVACQETTPPSPEDAPESLEITLNDQVFTLELALTEDERTQGLSDRESLADDAGMLFAFPDDEVDVQQFVMRRCLFPIDIAFLDDEGIIVQMHEMQVEPLETPEFQLRRYSSLYPAQFAIELNAGTLEALGLSRGDVVELPLEQLKQWAQ